jgi:hypothetical protein
MSRRIPAGLTDADRRILRALWERMATSAWERRQVELNATWRRTEVSDWRRKRLELMHQLQHMEDVSIFKRVKEATPAQRHLLFVIHGMTAVEFCETFREEIQRVNEDLRRTRPNVDDFL